MHTLYELHTLRSGAVRQVYCWKEKIYQSGAEKLPLDMKGQMIMGIFDKIDELIDEEEQEKELERERLMELSEKELLVEILLKLEEIKDNQFFYSD